MPLNELTPQRQAEIAAIVDNLKLSASVFYPEDSLQDLIKATIANVQIKEYDFKGNRRIRGAVFRKSEKYERPVIAVNSNQSDRSKTFTLAHEFAHYILKHNPKENYFIDDLPFDGSSAMQDEGEANFFASVLLMPKEEFARLDQPFVTDAKLADYFGVSEGVVKVRREWIRRNDF